MFAYFSADTDEAQVMQPPALLPSLPCSLPIAHFVANCNELFYLPRRSGKVRSLSAN